MNIVIRAATAEDADFLAHGNAAMALETEHKELDPGVVGAGVRAALADPGKGLYFIAERDGQRVGQLMFTFEWSDWRNGTFWWIQSVYVLPQARRSGVFRALFRHVEQLAERDPGVCGIRLYVERENTRAQATYRHCGLHDAGYTVMEVDYTAADRGTHTPETTTMLAKGTKAPEFELSDQDGRKHTLKSLLADGPLILYFYPADFTPGCTKEACSFRDLHQDLLRARLRVVGVSPQDVDSHRKFAEKHGLNFPLLADPDKVAVKAYDVDGPLGFGVRRGTYLIGKDGRIQDSVLADLRIGAHEAFVANAIKSGAGKQ